MSGDQDHVPVAQSHVSANAQDWLNDHYNRYLSSGGTVGHIIDTSLFGNDRFTPHLLLHTTGRKSGKRLIVPLSYGMYGKEWVIIGSRGGTVEHPAWYLNLKAAAKPECVVQIGTQAFRCAWREVEGEERKPVWDYMCGLFDPYVRYEKKIAGRRVMPVIMLKLLEEVAVETP
jgi:deazaflavin-dependent oxidoreductase (nitroreductase family)